MQHNIESLKRKWNMHEVSVDRLGQAGGLALLWRKSVTVDLQSLSQNHIDVHVSIPGETLKWRCTGFYGFADQAFRYRSWELLRHLADHNDLAWVVGGDFNEILSNEEKVGGRPRASHLIENFRQALLDCSLADVGYIGDKFTWTNNRTAPNTVRCRLD